MSSPKPPKQPDVVNAAREQGQQNIEAARVTAALNRVNQSGPGGSVSFSQDPNNKDSFTQTTTLAPEQQRIYDAQTGGAGDRAEAAQRNFGMYGMDLGAGIDASGLPMRRTTASPTDQTGQINARSVATGRINTMGLPQLPGQNDFSGERQRVEDAMYGRGARRLDDQFSRRDEDTRAQLINRGLREGTEAYANAQRDLNESRTDAYGDLRDRAISAGSAEQSRLFADALQARQQGFGENQTQAQFRNQSAQQNFTNELQRGAFQNDAQQQEFMQRLADAQLGNQQRDAGINEQVTNQQQTLQGLDFLYGGSGVQGPTPNAPGSAGQVQPADFQGAVNQDYANRFGIYNSRAQAAQQQQQSAAATAAALAIAFSDRRLKTDVRKEGEMPSGLSIYSYRYKGDPKLSVGVMSDETKALYPDAVLTHGSGYDMVDYGALVAHETEAA